MGKLSYKLRVPDAVAGLPVPLPGLRRTAEPDWSTRLQTVNSAQLTPVVRV